MDLFNIRIETSCRKMAQLEKSLKDLQTKYQCLTYQISRPELCQLLKTQMTFPHWLNEQGDQAEDVLRVMQLLVVPPVSASQEALKVWNGMLPLSIDLIMKHWPLVEASASIFEAGTHFDQWVDEQS